MTARFQSLVDPGRGQVRFIVQNGSVRPSDAIDFRGMIISPLGEVYAVNDTGQSRVFQDGIAIEPDTGLTIVGPGPVVNTSMGGLGVNAAGCVVFGQTVDVVHQGVGLTNSGELILDLLQGFGENPDGSLGGLVNGIGAFGFARATGATVTDFEGLIRLAKVDELRFFGARRVENQLDSTEDISQSPWASTNPVEGTNIAVFNNQGDALLQNGEAVSANNAVGARVELAGEGTITLRIRNDGTFDQETALTVTLTAEKKPYFVSHTFTADFSAARFEVLKKEGDTAERVYVNKAQLESLTGQANQNPSEYVSVDVGNDPELIANGNFDTDTDGWTSESGTVSLVSGRGRMTNTEGTYNHITYTQNLRAGRYLLKGTLRKVAGNNTTGIRVGTDKTAAETTLISLPCIGELGKDLANVANATDLSLSFDFIVPSGGSTVYIVGMNNGSTVGEYIEIDDVSVKDFVFPSYADGVRSFAYENGNTVDGDGVVTEAKGAAITDWYAPYEPAATNVIAESQDFTTGGGAWSVGAGDVETEESSVLSLLQGLNWWRLQAAAGGASTDRVINSGVHTKAAAAEYWTLTVYANKDEVDWLSINMANTPGSAGVGQYYDLANGVVGTPYETTWTYVSSDMEEITPGIYRVRLTGQTNTDTGIRARIFLAEGDGDVDFTLSAGEGLYIQGAQLEKSLVPTSYIPTSGGSSNRTADDGAKSFDYRNWSQQAGTVLVEVNFGAINFGAGNWQAILNVRNYRPGVLYEETSLFNSYDGTSGSSVALAPEATDNWFEVALDYSTGSTLDVGMRDITGAGAFVWNAAPPIYDGEFTSDSVINMFFGISEAPIKIRNLKIYKSRLGKAAIEDMS